MDPPLGTTYFESGYKDDPSHVVHVDVQPFLGPYEGFTELPRFSDDWASSIPHRSGDLFTEIIHYWESAFPPSFNPENPTIQSLSFYPLRIAAAEWVKYVAVMQRCIKQYEYQGDELLNLDKFNTDLRELQGWRRRSMLSQDKIRSIIKRLEPLQLSRAFEGSHGDGSIAELVEDFEHIIHKIETAGRRLENMLPVVASLVQIMEARQSFAETANIRRLTILALIFVPLSYVSSLFSMNEQNMPGSPYFWVYFTVAIPVTAFVFIVALIPVEQLHKITVYLKGRVKRRGRNSHPNRDHEPELMDSVSWKESSLPHRDTSYTTG